MQIGIQWLMNLFYLFRGKMCLSLDSYLFRILDQSFHCTSTEMYTVMWYTFYIYINYQYLNDFLKIIIIICWLPSSLNPYFVLKLWGFLAGILDSFIFSKNQRSRELISYSAVVMLVIRYQGTGNKADELRKFLLKPLLLPPALLQQSSTCTNSSSALTVVLPTLNESPQWFKEEKTRLGSSREEPS